MVVTVTVNEGSQPAVREAQVQVRARARATGRFAVPSLGAAVFFSVLDEASIKAASKQFDRLISEASLPVFHGGGEGFRQINSN